MAEPATPAPELMLEDYAPYRLAVASARVSRLIARAYEDRFGLTIPQWRLMCVLNANGALAQLQLVAKSAMDKIAVSRAASALLARHLVAVSAGGDRRLRVLELTPAGRALFEEIAPLALQLEAELLRRAGIGDGAALRGMCERLQQAAEAITGEAAAD